MLTKWPWNGFRQFLKTVWRFRGVSNTSFVSSVFVINKYQGIRKHWWKQNAFFYEWNHNKCTLRRGTKLRFNAKEHEIETTGPTLWCSSINISWQLQVQLSKWGRYYSQRQPKVPEEPRRFLWGEMKRNTGTKKVCGRTAPDKTRRLLQNP